MVYIDKVTHMEVYLIKVCSACRTIWFHEGPEHVNYVCYDGAEGVIDCMLD